MRNIIDEKLHNVYVKGLKSMIESCFAYGGLSKDNPYIMSYIKKLDEQEFHRIYDEHAKYLRENFMVIHNVHTCSEGVTYNSLKQIK